MLGKNIKQIRRDNKLTQEAFGKKILHTKSTISKWENDQATPDIATLKKISELFDVDLNSLIKDMDTKKKPKTASRVVFKWDRANYSGNKNIAHKKHSVWFHLLWSSLLIGGLCLMILPLCIAQDGYGKAELILTLVGVFVLIGDIIFVAIIFKRDNRVSYAVRWNIKFELYNDKIKMISNKSTGVKLLYPKNILDIETSGAGSETQVKILLDNNESIKLFDVDSSVSQRLNLFKKGGSNEN